MPSKKTPAAEALLTSTLDYAGLFPPARLDMAGALDRYVKAVGERHRRLLGPFVLPLDRLEEFLECAQPKASALEDPIPISMITPSDRAKEVREARARMKGVAVIGALEVPPSEPDAIAAFADAVPEDVQVFHEVPIAVIDPVSLRLEEDALRRLDAVALAGACAKVRTGGLEQKAFPSIFALAAFVEECKQRGVPFKATAGLHHPTRGVHRTDGEEGVVVHMHGFLNLSIGAALLWAGKVTPPELVEVLSESRIEAFEVGRREITWRDRVLVGDEVRRCRRSFFQSFGTCSIDEPVDDLEAANWIQLEEKSAVNV